MRVSGHVFLPFESVSLADNAGKLELLLIIFFHLLLDKT